MLGKVSRGKNICMPNCLNLDPFVREDVKTVPSKFLEKKIFSPGQTVSIVVYGSGMVSSIYKCWTQAKLLVSIQLKTLSIALKENAFSTYSTVVQEVGLIQD